MTYGPITDASNTFNTTGLSDEVEAMLDYLLCAKAAGLDVVATSTTDHAINTTSGNRSRHRMAGTNGEGLAIDCRRRQRGNDIHRAVFDAFVLVETKLQELIYAGAPYNIKAGKRVAPYAVASHHDHVHVSVVKGTFLAWPGTKPAPVSHWKWSNHMPGPLEFTSAAVCPTGGYWKQSAEGGIYANEGAPYHGAYNQHPDLGGNVRYFTALIALGDGYIQIANDGAWYQWPAK